MTSSLSIVTHSPDETRNIGRILGQQAWAGALFLLSGILGVGKTCLIQGVAFGLGVKEYARSPTFVLATRYIGRHTLYHMDLFRIDDPLELLDLGLEEYLDSGGVCVVEWAEKAAELFPQERLWITIEYGSAETDRLIRLEAQGEEYQRLLDGLKQALAG